ncbi:MAG: NAD+ synthase [Gammaproteobacteria bacterium]|nr:NAD+ synthase [Gammaproteobacteria bacterium]
MRTLTIALGQLDFIVGDVPGNTRKIRDSSRIAHEQGADVIVYPELTLVGYPPEDLLWRPGLKRKVNVALDKLCHSLPADIAVVIGHPHWTEDGKLMNAASVFRSGKLLVRYFKMELPNYAVFDERRYFTPGDKPAVFDVEGVLLGVTICEDTWLPEASRKSREAGAQIILNLNASPFHVGKTAQREQIVARRSQETNVPVVYVNLVGAQDELVYDGTSFVTNSNGVVVYRSESFRESMSLLKFECSENGVVPEASTPLRPLPGKVESVYQALVCGVRDYVLKNGFKGVVIGLSGGIDSALTLCVACDALGEENVEAVMLPSRYTSDMSLEDAKKMASNLGVEYHVISIEQSFNAFLDTLKETFADSKPDVTEENIQARCRGVILMAISNKRGKMVLTTGNKSEMAMGYSTLYGDMAGGYNALKDVPKTLVYELSRYCNRDQEVIPQRIIDRPPSAELRPDQKDQDSLPPYEILDGILEKYVERDESIEQIIADGYDETIVRRVVWLLDRNEYKRRQAAPGVKITARAFGKDRRYPITSGYSELDN